MGDRERNKKRLLELLQAAGTGNAYCADCGAAGKVAAARVARYSGPARGPRVPSPASRPGRVPGPRARLLYHLRTRAPNSPLLGQYCPHSKPGPLTLWTSTLDPSPGCPAHSTHLPLPDTLPTRTTVLDLFFRTQPLPPPSDPNIPHTTVPRPRTQVFPGGPVSPPAPRTSPGLCALRPGARQGTLTHLHRQLPASSCGSVLPRSPLGSLKCCHFHFAPPQPLALHPPDSFQDLHSGRRRSRVRAKWADQRVSCWYLSSRKEGRLRGKAWAVGTCQALASPGAPSLALVSSASSSPSSPPCSLTPQIPTGPLTSWASLSV